ncbi:MAG: tRNA 2-thiocytidine(32) synthetase TtcA [Planctomycetota bacterium]
MCPAADLRRKLSRTMLRTVGAYGLIGEGDRIFVAVSGGKDSSTLLDLLWEARRKAPVRFELVAGHLDLETPGRDPSALERWLRELGCPYEIIREDARAAVEARSAAGETRCVACARFRRGILYSAARRLGSNKVALGHHRDDALETLLLNLLYSGRLQAMPARYRTRGGDIEVIRPLIECAEEDIARHAEASGYPRASCSLCGPGAGEKREEVARLLREIERSVPNARRVMLSALKNVRPTHLLDREVAEAWEAMAGRYEPRR